LRGKSWRQYQQKSIGRWTPRSISNIGQLAFNVANATGQESERTPTIRAFCPYVRNAEAKIRLTTWRTEMAIHEHILSQGAAEYATFGRHMEFDFPIEQFDNSKFIHYYAALFVCQAHADYTLDEYAEMVKGLLKDDGADILFKREVRRLRKSNDSNSSTTI
jgi:hypothetical protein